MAVITINGKEVEAADGTLILDAARQAGYEIPTFCYHAKLSKIGSCRMCLVEIEGMRKLQPSCVTPVMDGMKVQTESPDVVSARKGQLEFLLINHPLDCPVCDQAGECDLQDLTYKYGAPEGRFRWKKRTFPRRNMGPTITKEMNRCIACRRCSRFCEEISGDYSITELNRGNELEMGTFCHTPIESEFVGNTVQICPVGALTSSAFRFKARSWDLRKAETICPHCSVGCSITSESKYVSASVTHLHQTKSLGCTPALDASELKVLRNNATEDKGVTDLSICDRGRYGYHFINSEKRLTKPLVREGDKLVETSWDKALAVAAERLAGIKDKSGAGAIGGITSGICTNEDGYVFQKFLREVVGTGNIDIARFSKISGESARKLASMRASINDVKAADVVLMLGSSVSSDTPILSMNAGIAGRMGGAKLMMVSSGENRLLPSKPERYDIAPGSELAVIGAITRAIIDKGLVSASAKGDADKVSAGLSGIDMDGLGISKSDIESIAASLSNASRGFILFGDDVLSSADSDQVVGALYNLAVLAGYNGEKGRLVYAPASGNYVGTLDVGVVPDKPGGLGWHGMLGAMTDGKLNALSVMGDDPVGTASDRDAVQAALAKLDLLIVQDLFLTKTAEMAHVVLPAVSYAEKEGTVTNLEGRVQSLARSIKPLGEGREDWRIISDLSAKMGSAPGYKSCADITTEISASVAGYAGATPDSIGRDGIFVGPVTGLNCDSVTVAAARIERDKDYPVQVVSGRDVFLNGSLTAIDEGLLKLSPGPRALLGEAAAKSAGIADGDEIKIETRKGSVSLVASVTRRAADNTVIVPVNHPDLDASPLFEGINTGLPGRVFKA